MDRPGIRRALKRTATNATKILLRSVTGVAATEIAATEVARRWLSRLKVLLGLASGNGCVGGGCGDSVKNQIHTRSVMASLTTVRYPPGVCARKGKEKTRYTGTVLNNFFYKLKTRRNSYRYSPARELSRERLPPTGNKISHEKRTMWGRLQRRYNQICSAPWATRTPRKSKS